MFAYLQWRYSKYLASRGTWELNINPAYPLIPRKDSRQLAKENTPPQKIIFTLKILAQKQHTSQSEDKEGKRVWGEVSHKSLNKSDIESC